MSIGSRIALSMISLVALTAVSIGVWNYYSVTKAIEPVALARLEQHADNLGYLLDSVALQARADALSVAQAPFIREIVRTRPAEESGDTDIWKTRLGQALSAQLENKEDYLQFRFIGVGDNGRELVRVDRSGPNGSIRVVVPDELQAKGERDYFLATLQLAEGEVYISPINLNREGGTLEVPQVPVMRVACPVYGDTGSVAGIVIINLDMRRILDGLRAAAVPGGRLYVINEEGDFLLHPDPEKEFGFELGRPYRWDDEFPAVTLVGSPGSEARVIDLDSGGQAGVGVSAKTLAGGPRVHIVELLPREIIFSASEGVRTTSILAGALVTLAAIFAAAALARSLVRPIQKITRAAELLRNGSAADLPTAAPGEIGILAQSFHAMQTSIRTRTEALEAEIEHRRAVERLLEEQMATMRLYASIIESTDDAAISEALDGTITAWNPAAERMFGYSAAEAIGQPIFMIVPDDRRDEVLGFLDSVGAGVPVEHYETLRRRKDGSTVDVSLTISPVRDEEGVVVGASIIARDITAEKEARELIQLSVEAAPSGMILVSSDGTIRMANAEAERLFGYTRGELVGHPVELLLPAAFRDSHPAQRAAYFRSPEKRAMGAGRNLRARRADGSEFPVEVGLSPAQSRHGAIVLAAIIDITERQKTEEAIVRYTEELKRSNAELEQFAYVASHDLQEPLRMVASYTELLAKRYEGQLDEKADRYIFHAVDGAKRMKQLIRDLLTFSRVGTRARAPEDVDVNRIVRRVIVELEPLIRESNATVTVDDLGNATADATQLGQVFQNLIGNALKFRTEDRPPSVHVGTTLAHGTRAFYVRDNGIGIPPESAGRIFQMFQRLHERDVYPGSGIGLAIVKKIVDRHGGTVWFESSGSPGQLTGVTFYFTLESRE